MASSKRSNALSREDQSVREILDGTNDLSGYRSEFLRAAIIAQRLQSSAQAINHQNSLDLIMEKIRSLEAENIYFKNELNTAKEFLDDHKNAYASLEAEYQFIVAQNLELTDKLKSVDYLKTLSPSSPTRSAKKQKKSHLSNPENIPSANPAKPSTCEPEPVPVTLTHNSIPSQPTTSILRTSQQESTLANMDEAPEPMENGNDQENDDEGFTLVTSQKKRYPPIRIAPFGDWVPLRQKLIERTKYTFIAKAFGEEIKLIISNSDDYRAVIHYLEEAKINHIVFPIEEENTFKVVLKRVHEKIKIEEIQDDLIRQNINPKKVSRLQKSAENKSPALVLVQLVNNPANKGIYNIDTILGTMIEVAVFNNKREVVQCYNCQGFNHGSTSCRMPTKCVRCGKNHKAFECPLPKGSPLHCANCGQNHPSSYRGCPEFPKHHPTYYARLQREQAKASTNPAKPVNPAETTSSGNSHQQPKKPNPKKSLFFPAPPNSTNENKRSYSQVTSPKKPRSKTQNKIALIETMMSKFLTAIIDLATTQDD